MNLVVRLKELNEIGNLSQLGVDVFCLDTKFTAKRIANFSINDIKEIIKSTDKDIYVLINKMIHDSDILELTDYLNEIKDLNISGIVINDLTVFAIAKKLNIENLIIYQPGTFNTDSFSKEYLYNKNIKGITISREVTLNEIVKISEDKTGLELSYIIHGYLDMFYSKRKLLTRYIEYKKMNGLDIVNNYDLRLNEEIRPNDFYPILEDQFGTHIFRSKKLISIDELKTLSKNIKTFFIERIFISDNEYYDSIKLYKNLMSKQDFLDKYANYGPGFYYKRTEKVKGELDEN